MDKLAQAPESVYEDRLVCFLDILGFSNLVAQSAHKVETQKSLYDFLQKYSNHQHAKEVFAGFRNGDGSRCGDSEIESLKSQYSYRFAQFSDSFIFSVKTEDRFSIQYFPILVGQFMLHALDLGFLVRGGISKGAMVHEENGPAFGPAFIQAYRIETNQSVFARVVLSTEAYECIGNASSTSVDWMEAGPDEEFEITVASFLRQKYSSSLASEKRIPALCEALDKVARLLNGLEDSEKDRVGGKYKYVIALLRRAIEEASK